MWERNDSEWLIDRKPPDPSGGKKENNPSANREARKPGCPIREGKIASEKATWEVGAENEKTGTFKTGTMT